jgi:hypothetical protein
MGDQPIGKICNFYSAQIEVLVEIHGPVGSNTCSKIIFTREHLSDL